MIAIKLSGFLAAVLLAGGVFAPTRLGAEAPVDADHDVPLIRELMRRRGGDPAALAQLVQLTRPCSPAKAAELFDVLAEAHRGAGNLNLAAETRQLLVEQYADQPAAEAAVLLWLVRLYSSSSEVARAHRPPARKRARRGVGR